MHIDKSKKKKRKLPCFLYTNLLLGGGIGAFPVIKVGGGGGGGICPAVNFLPTRGKSRGRILSQECRFVASSNDASDAKLEKHIFVWLSFFLL